MFDRRYLLLAFFGVAATSALPQELPSPARCDLNVDAWDQARCLLAPVNKYGMLGNSRASLPAPWKKLLFDRQSALPAVESFRTYLRRAYIPEREIGGDIGQPISRNLHGETARYLIIHDTSTLFGISRKSTFPSFLNARAWSDTTLEALEKKRNAHVFIGRTGQSATAVDLSEALVTTKFEKLNRDRLEGLFIGVENIQPRMLDRKGIDSIAPVPGFTQAQLKRLAVVYIAASIRAGRWLIPAFHAVLDSGIADGHDDPQHFDLDRFSAALTNVLSDMEQPGHALHSKRKRHPAH